MSQGHVSRQSHPRCYSDLSRRLFSTLWWRHWMETFSALLAFCGQWRWALMFSLICAWINGWANNREVGDLRRYGAHYDVILMISLCLGVRYTCRTWQMGFRGTCFCGWKHPPNRMARIVLDIRCLIDDPNPLLNLWHKCRCGWSAWTSIHEFTAPRLFIWRAP